MKKALFIICIASVLLSSCKQETYEEPVPGVPVFSVTGLRNGEPFTISAGDNGIIQTATLTRNKYGVMEWNSVLGSASCTTCEPAFTLTLLDAEGVNYEDCADLGIFQNTSMKFSTAESETEFASGNFHLDTDNQNATTVQYYIDNQASPQGSHFDFQQTGIKTVSAQFDILSENGEDINEVQVDQTIYSGANIPLSAPFNYEFIAIGDEEQQEEGIRLKFPADNPALRATYWRINGETYTQPSLDAVFSADQSYQIELHFSNDNTGMLGMYKLQFNHGFPSHQDINDDHHMYTAPSIHVDWETPNPNYEKAVIRCNFNGNMYTSITPLNLGASKRIIFNNQEHYAAGIDGRSAIKFSGNFNVTLVNELDVADKIELQDCKIILGFVVPE